MDNFTSVKIELEVAASRIISQVMLSNDTIEKEIEAGVKAAVLNFNFQAAVEKSVTKCIEDAIKQSTDWGVIRDAVKKETDKIVGTYIQASIDKFHADFLNTHK